MKKFFTTLLLTIFVINSKAYQFEVDGIYYNISSSTNKTVAVTCKESYTASYSGEVSIPESVVYNSSTYSVTSIGPSAFYNSSDLTSITIPKTVSSIGENAFYNCGGLNKITVDSENTFYDSRDNCNALIKTSTNSLITGSNNTVIPNTVKSIGKNAFYGCSNLKSLDIPNSVTSIGSSAFYDCSGLTSMTIPNSVTKIEYYTFRNCSNLKTVSIPNTVTFIGYCAFQSCSSLTSIDIPASMQTIETAAFSWCLGLKTIKIPSSVTSIDGNIFSSCPNIESIIVESGNPKYDSRDNCNAIVETSSNSLISGCKNTIIPSTVTSIGTSAFSNCTGLTYLTINKSLTSIGSYAFSGCSGLTIITVDADNPVFDSRDNCNAIIKKSDNTLILGCKNTIIPNTVTIIGEYSFYGCSDLTSIEIPTSVKSIMYYAFADCKGLVSITIPSLVTLIGQMAFDNCTGLTNVTIPASVTNLGGAFSHCTSLTTLYNYATTPQFLTPTDFGNAANCILYVLKGYRDVYAGADYWKEFKEIIEFEPSAIDYVRATNNIIGSEEYYDINGVKSNGFHSGLNIIKTKDGVKKVMK